MNGEEIWVYSFSPLIQLLAGIYLLFIYEAKLHINPLERRFKILICELTTCSLKFNKKNMLSDVEKHYWNKWNIYKIRKTALLFFLYCAFVLFFFGMEYSTFFRTYCYSLLPMGISLLLFSIFVSGDKINNTYIILAYCGAIIVFVVNCLLIHFDCTLINLSFCCSILLSIMICFTGIFVWIWYVTLNYKWVQTLIDDIKKIDKRYTKFLTDSINPDTSDKIKAGEFSLSRGYFDIVEFTEYEIQGDINKLMKKFNIHDH